MARELGIGGWEKATADMTLHYAREAIQDLERLRAFIAEKNPAAAARISRQLLEGIQNLKRFPQLGREVSKAPDPALIRDLILDRYVVRYLIAGDVLYILRIWHQKENRSQA